MNFKRREENPYKPSRPEHLEWDHGWDECDRSGMMLSFHERERKQRRARCAGMMSKGFMVLALFMAPHHPVGRFFGRWWR